MADRVAVLLDGGFVKKRLERSLGRFPTTKDVVAVVGTITGHARLANHTLYRAFYYDAPPFEGEKHNPFTGAKESYAGNPIATANKALIDALEFEPDFAVRRGVLLHHGWKLGASAMKSMIKSPRAAHAADFVPDLEQKGVDIRVALDMATIALKRIVDAIVLVTCDSDFVPVMKFARTEGTRVYLATLGQAARPELKAHADMTI
jgi:uncharacterized LabA/DUF88 family protein